jgi:vesicle-associated membrane protein 4
MDSRITQIHSEIDATKEVMLDNITQVLKRGERLEDLEHGAEDLAFQSNIFRTGASSLKNTMCWKNWKCLLLISFVISTIIGIIVLVLVLKFKPVASGTNSKDLVSHFKNILEKSLESGEIFL